MSLRLPVEQVVWSKSLAKVDLIEQFKIIAELNTLSSLQFRTICFKRKQNKRLDRIRGCPYRRTGRSYSVKPSSYSAKDDKYSVKGSPYSAKLYSDSVTDDKYSAKPCSDRVKPCSYSVKVYSDSAKLVLYRVKDGLVAMTVHGGFRCARFFLLFSL